MIVVVVIVVVVIVVVVVVTVVDVVVVVVAVVVIATLSPAPYRWDGRTAQPISVQPPTLPGSWWLAC